MYLFRAYRSKERALEALKQTSVPMHPDLGCCMENAYRNDCDCDRECELDHICPLQ